MDGVGNPFAGVLERLASEAFDWYRFDEALPCPRDHETLAAVQAFMAAPLKERENAAHSVDVYSAHALVSFAERCASWALDSRDSRFVVYGLAAVGWQWEGCEDPCDGIAVMGALYDACLRLDAPVAAAFAEAASATPGAANQAFADFLTRTDLDQIAKIMGYAVRMDPERPCYVRSW